MNENGAGAGEERYSGTERRGRVRSSYSHEDTNKEERGAGEQIRGEEMRERGRRALTDQRWVDNKRTQARSQNREETRAGTVSLLTVALLLLNHRLFVIHEHHKDADVTLHHLGPVVLAPVRSIVLLAIEYFKFIAHFNLCGCDHLQK